ncbi:hypothetical protein V6N12_072398 [Hibiscus sabdariffa]|uniref:Cytochrome f large domain-containing protein n=1 Tax=Hibiscus sabdariffa TaxID=183260 RepID=A0ABR2FML4_9ROSI
MKEFALTVKSQNHRQYLGVGVRDNPVDIEVPQAVLPDTVFEAVVRISYDMQLKQVLANGPVPGQKYSEITFPILSPDPASNKDVHFLKYPIYVGGNRGRGQIYPDGNKRPELLVSEGESIKLDQPLTINPNVGEFSQRMQK